MKLTVRKSIMAGLCVLVAPGVESARAAELDQAAVPQRPDRPDLLFVSITINGAAQDGEYLLAQRAGDFFVRTADLARWSVRFPSDATIAIDNEAFIALTGIPGVTFKFDAARQHLALTVPAQLFEEFKVTATAPHVQLTQSAFAAFLNYDLSAQYDKTAQATAFLETGVSDDWGLLANTMSVGHGAGTSKVTRFDSYFLRDDPVTLTRLVVGDAVTDARDWSREVRFGGVRFGTEFSLVPNFVTFPTPAFTGRTAIPSNVELLVENAQRFQTDVAPGPFSISQVPLVNGAGEVTLVIRDALGVERRVKSSYYVSSRLLSPGLSAWSFEAGAERRDYGVRNFSYCNPFASGSYRRGITDWLTFESRTEISGDVQMAGAGADLVWPAFGEFGVAGAVSRGKDGK